MHLRLVETALGVDHVQVVGQSAAVERAGHRGDTSVGFDQFAATFGLLAAGRDRRQGLFDVGEGRQHGLLVVPRRFVVGRHGRLFGAPEFSEGDERFDERPGGVPDPRTAGGQPFDRTRRRTSAGRQRDRRKPRAPGLSGLRRGFRYAVVRLPDVGSSAQQLRGQSHGNLRGVGVGAQGQPFAPKRVLRRELSEQRAERKGRLHDGPPVLRDVRFGRADQTAGLLECHAVRHAVAEHGVDQCRRLAPQLEGTPGDREVALVFEQREVGRRHFGRQREPHSFERPRRGGDFGLGGFFGAPQRSEQRNLPREGRLDGVGLHDSRGFGVFASGLHTEPDLRQVLRPHDPEVGPGLFDARGGRRQIAVAFQRAGDEGVERRIAEHFPPAAADARRVLREAFGVNVTVRDGGFGRIEPRRAGARKQGRGHCDFQFHACSSCLDRVRRRSKPPMCPTR